MMNFTPDPLRTTPVY